MMNNTKKMLITGGAGCLGSNLIERYLPIGYEILVVDNFATSSEKVLPKDERLTIIEGSVADKDLMDQIFNDFQPSYVIHSAASYKDPDDWSADVMTNVLGMVNIVKAAKRNIPKQIINFQTALCYGKPLHVPIKIDHPLSPFTSYGISKTAGELYLEKSGLPYVSLRLANICGPRLSIGPIPTFYKRLISGQDCFCTNAVRDFIDMTDFLDLMDKILYNDLSKGTYNVSTGIGYSISDVFNAVANFLGKNDAKAPVIQVGDDDVETVVLDPAETEAIFNWKARVSFEKMIENQLNWYEKYGVKEVYSHLEMRG